MLINQRNSKEFKFLKRAAQSFLSIMVCDALFIGRFPEYKERSAKVGAKTGTVVTDRQSLVCCVPI